MTWPAGFCIRGAWGLPVAILTQRTRSSSRSNTSGCSSIVLLGSGSSIFLGEVRGGRSVSFLLKTVAQSTGEINNTVTCYMHGHIHKELLFHLESKLAGSVWQFGWQQDINVELSKLGLCQIVVSLCHLYSSQHKNDSKMNQFTMFINSSFLPNPSCVDIIWLMNLA